MPLTWLFDGQRADEAGERVLEEEVVGEDVVDDAAGDVGVAHPAAAVAFGRVPDVVLHAEVAGVGAGFPDAVEEGVGGLEGALVLDRVVDVFEADGAEFEDGGTGEEANLRVAKGGFGPGGGAARRDVKGVDAEVGLVVRFFDGFTIRDRDGDGRVCVGEDLNAPGDLAAEVEGDAGNEVHGSAVGVHADGEFVGRVLVQRSERVGVVVGSAAANVAVADLGSRKEGMREEG